MQIKIKSSSVCLLLIFLSAFYQLPVVKFNLTFVSLTLLPFFAFVCWYKRLAIKVGFVFVISLMLYLVFVTLYFGWEGGSYSIINIAFYLSTLFLLRVSVQYYSFGTCFVAFYFGSLLFYTYELISRFYNVFYEESVLVSSFYVLKMNGTVFNDTNVVGLNVLFLFIMSMSFARSSAGALNHQLNSFYFRLSQLYLFILIILTFSRAAIIIAFAYCFYLFILRVNLVFKFIFWWALFLPCFLL